MFHRVLKAAAALVLALCLAGSPIASAAFFQDIPETHAAYGDIEALRVRGILQGSKGKFRPNEPISRQAFLSMLCRAAGLDDRSLETGSGWAGPAIAYASWRGWLPKEGLSDPTAPITRELAARLLISALRPDAVGTAKKLSFLDHSKIDPDCLPYVQAAVELGLMDCGANKRFHPKEALTRADAAVLLNRALPAPAAAGETVQVPVLMYHDVSYLGQGYSKTPEIFERQMKELKDAGFHTVFFSQVIDYVENGAPLPDKPIVISVDDGYATNYTYLYPILKKLDMKIELSVIGDAIRYTEWGLRWEQIQEMCGSGLVSIQAHTMSIHTDHTAQGGRMGVLKLASESWADYVNLIAEDTAAVTDYIEQGTGKRPVVYTYPMGKWNAMVEAISGQMGYKVSLTTKDGVAKVVQGDPSSLRLMNRIGMDFRNGSVVKTLRSFGYQFS